jgi:AcrR family transcriptional regulator
MDVIARRADLGNATLYRHFPTRELLVAAVYRPDIEDLASSALALAARHAPRDALELWVREHFIPVQEQHGFAVVLKDALARAPEVFSVSKKRLTDAAGGLVRAAQHAGVVRQDISPRDILRMAHGIAVASENAPQARERMLTVMFDGLRPAPDRACSLCAMGAASPAASRTRQQPGPSSVGPKPGPMIDGR